MQNSSYSHGQTAELSSCKEKVITSIHSWANCSNLAVNQQSTPASELICIYHGCLLDRFSQANWSTENVSNDNIMPTTPFLQITFAWCVYCLQSVWKTSNGKEDMFLFLSTYSNQKNPKQQQPKKKKNHDSIGKHFRWGNLDITLPFLPAPFPHIPFLFILFHYLSVPRFFNSCYSVILEKIN